MNFSEGSYYKLQKDYYEHIKLECTYVEGSTVWLKSEIYPASDTSLLYKLDRKSKKLYVFNTKVQAYDLVEGSLSEYGKVAIENHITLDNTWITSI